MHLPSIQTLLVVRQTPSIISNSCRCHYHFSSNYRYHKLISLLNHCSTLCHLHQTHGFMLVRALDQDNIFLSQFIRTSGSLGFSSYAYSVFAYNARSSIFLYNNIIWALSSSSSSAAKCAISLFNTIQQVGLRPDSYSFPFVLRAVAYLSTIDVGIQIHCQAIAHGLNSHVSVATALVQMYSSCGSLSYARNLFDELSFRDVSLWNAMVGGYAKMGDLANAGHLFECMPEKNVISWTTIIAGYAQTNSPNEAIMLFRRMQLDNVQPDEIAILAVLSACADLGALELGEWIHNYIEKHKLHMTVPLSNSLIDMYAKSGNISKALEVFTNMKRKTVITWTTMIAGLALHGLGKEALYMFSCMEKARITPNQVTFIAILSACTHVGFVELGRDFFTCMASTYGIEPKIEHYGCMIDLLGRAGYLEEAKQVVSLMPFEANAAIWGSLLAASTRLGDAELAAEALGHLIKLEPQNSGNYALLCNTYAALGSWNESRTVRKFMRDKGVEKMPGVSFIEVNGRVFEFTAGDIQFNGLFDVLYSIDEQLRIVDS